MSTELERHAQNPRAHHDNSNDPTALEKAALQGTAPVVEGTRYVTSETLSSQEIYGIIKLATQGEIDAGVDGLKALTSAILKQHLDPTRVPYEGATKDTDLGGKNLKTTGNITSTEFILGDPEENTGAWRVLRTGEDLSFDRRENGIWITKYVIKAKIPGSGKAREEPIPIEDFDPAAGASLDASLAAAAGAEDQELIQVLGKLKSSVYDWVNRDRTEILDQVEMSILGVSALGKAVGVEYPVVVPLPDDLFTSGGVIAELAGGPVTDAGTATRMINTIGAETHMAEKSRADTACLPNTEIIRLYAVGKLRETAKEDREELMDGPYGSQGAKFT